MRKSSLFAVLLLACTLASAAPVLPPCATKAYGGPGVGGNAGATSTGDWAGWWCPNADGTWVSWHYASLDKFKTLATMNSVIKTLAQSTDPLASAQQLVTQLSIEPTDPADVVALKALHDTAIAGLEATRPAPPVVQTKVWRTPPATSRATYTIYTAAANKITGVTGRVATPAALCRKDPALQVLNGTSTFLPLAGGADNEVTLCQEVPA